MQQFDEMRKVALRRLSEKQIANNVPKKIYISDKTKTKI